MTTDDEREARSRRLWELRGFDSESHDTSSSSASRSRKLSTRSSRAQLLLGAGLLLLFKAIG